MDNSFRKMSGEIKAVYNPIYWMEMESTLDNVSMDSAYQTAAGSVSVPLSQSADFSEVNDVFLDDAFRGAAGNQATTFSSSHWNEFLAQEKDLVQNDAFTVAANATTVAYHPVFWNDADTVLQQEGLHYEYKSHYWSEAKNLLDLADRRAFFYRWSGVASLLLLISAFGGASLQPETTTDFVSENGIPAEEIFQTNFVSSDPKANGEILDEDRNDVRFDKSDFAASESNLHNSGIAGQNISAVDYASSHLVDMSSADPSIDVMGGNGNPAVSENDHSASGSTNELSSSGSVAHNVGRILNHNERDWTVTKKYENDSRFVLIAENGTIMRPVQTISNEPLISPMPHVSIEENPKYKSRPSHFLSLAASIGVGREYGGSVLDLGKRTTVGIQYRRISYGALHRFEFGANAGVNQMSQTFLGTERHSSQFYLDGSFSKAWYKLRLTAMYNVTAGITAGFKINSRHKITLGAAYDRLIGVKSNMSYQLSSDDEIVTVNNNWGIKDGVNPFDVRFSFGYEYALAKRLSLQANASCGLFDRTENDFLQNTFFDREAGVSIGIKYDLIRIR